jgi:prefoldin subunit 5
MAKATKEELYAEFDHLVSSEEKLDALVRGLEEEIERLKKQHKSAQAELRKVWKKLDNLEKRFQKMGV